MTKTKQIEQVKSRDVSVCESRHSYLWCWIILAVIILCAAVIRGRLLSIPLERDEGEYAYIAQQMLEGVPPYISAYSLKLPGIFGVYATIFAFFGQSIESIHLGLLIVNAATIFIIFLLVKALFGPTAGVSSAAAFAVLSLSHTVLGLSANAEHFVLVPALAGILLIANPNKHPSLRIIFIAAVLQGLAFIIKQHGVFLGLFCAGYLFYREFRRRPIDWKRVIIGQLVFMTGAILPFAVVCLIIWKTGVFETFWFWTFTYAREYTKLISLSFAPKILLFHLGEMISFSTLIWILALLCLPILLFIRRIRAYAPFLIGLFIFSFLSVCPGFYFRRHYFILFMPALAIFAGVGFTTLCSLLTRRFSQPGRVVIICIIGLAVVFTSLYQERLFLFLNNPNTTCNLIYGSNPFVASIETARFIRDNINEGDKIMVLGSEPQIYFYSHRKAATHHIYMYPMMEEHAYAAEMQDEMIQEVESAEPEILVYVGFYTSWIPTKETVKKIFEWAGPYISENYERIGIVEFDANRKPIYRWKEQSASYNRESKDRIVVYKRKH